MKIETYLNAMLVAKCKIEAPTKIYDRNLNIKLNRQYLKFREHIIESDWQKSQTVLLLQLELLREILKQLSEAATPEETTTEAVWCPRCGKPYIPTEGVQ